MKYLDLSLPAPPANLACDEALVDGCDDGEFGPVLRVWESADPFVVVGYANEVEREVHLAICRDRGIPVLRRCTGGGAVVQGPGCLNFSLCLPTADPAFATVNSTNRYVMGKNQKALAPLLRAPVQIQGHTDLTLGNRKFSGNAQRRKRTALLFHGSFLLDFNLQLIQDLLRPPSKQPDYRASRAHLEFLQNLSIASAAVKHALREIWGAHEPLASAPHDRIIALTNTKYGQPEWNFRF